MLFALTTGVATRPSPVTRPAWAPLIPPDHLTDVVRGGGRPLLVTRLEDAPGRETRFRFVEQAGRLLRCAELHPDGPGSASVSEPGQRAGTAMH
ncbi:hypothetical protein ACE7GA_21435 [Roseomonas sp. CCTCC AB2023176]|uniref:hypothetical protein n=1 Tax=Roseomonas sp. CCTCC AB2023176 TaxID=3342640 RepID=UPI0035DA918D